MSKDKVKLLFEVEYDEDNIIKESVWAQKLDNNTYQIDNIPFYAYGYAYRDIVSATENEGQYYIDDLITPSGNSTIRILFQSNNNIKEIRDSLKDKGCDSEQSNVDLLIAVDVPLNINYKDIKDFLEGGEHDGRWEYEEGCISEKHKKEIS